jgi:hypothetical protein
MWCRYVISIDCDATFIFLILYFAGISLGALKVVFPQVQIPAEFEPVITNFLSPSFTPSLGIFLFFSVTLGVFKFAQVSSSRTVYREDE